VDRLTLVAFYGPKPDALSTLIAAAQEVLGAEVGSAFRPRALDDVHATILGLEDAPGCAGDVGAFIAAQLRAAPIELQFGGFSPDETALLSRGRSLHERSAVLAGGRAVVIGWPVERGRPTARLGELRRDCARFGAVHKYHRGTTAPDPDVYMVIGDTDAPRAETAEAVRAAVLDRPTSVRLTAADVSLVRYADPALPRASSTRWPI
jgi:hypothetical protein